MTATNGRTRAPATAVRGVSTHTTHALTAWRVARVPNGSVERPRGAFTPATRTLDVEAPGTVAAALLAHGEWSLDDQRDFDREEWWWECLFERPTDDPEAGEPVLVFEGLATVADVWLNGEPILESRSMFVAHEVPVGHLIEEWNTLVIRFRSTTDALDAMPRLKRARWRTRLVDDQRLRALRTTVLGRIPGWAPNAAPVGAWRPVRLEYRRALEVTDASVRATTDGADGLVAVDLELLGAPPLGATLHVGEHVAVLALETAEDGRTRLRGSVRVPAAERWWPHTHGAQPLYEARVVVDLAGEPVEVALGHVGFRDIAVDRANDGFAISVNGVPVFARGACWTPLDAVGLRASREETFAAVRQARDAGMNMLRVGGTMVYESQDFHDACDASGVLVWQDWMLANMDVHVGTAALDADIAEESRQLLARLQPHPSTAVLCGGSEVAQQAAMMGLSPDHRRLALAEDVLPSYVERWCEGTAYIPSSPWGGTHPFHSNAGVSHYYGVGAYLRPLADARLADVRFASECLAFANVPEPATCELVPGGAVGARHHPAWKRRVPRDAGVSWDFEDVREHYTELLFGVNARLLRTTDAARWLALGRVTSAEVMERTVAEWRRADSRCRGALVFFLRDLCPGAGWGVVDSTGTPKAAYHALRRAMAPRALLVHDEGVNGLYVTAANDRADVVRGSLEVLLFRGERTVARATAPVEVAAHGSTLVHVDAMLGGFVDSTYAYRFGPPSHDVAVLSWRDGSGALVADAFHFPAGLPNARVDDVGLVATVRAGERGEQLLTVRTRSFAQSIAVDLPGWVADDAYFHLAPGGERTVRLTPLAGGSPPDGHVIALNCASPCRVEVAP